MDFQINKANFLAFLTKARIGGIVKDLFLQSNDKQIFARFADQHRTMYGEVYESNVKISQPGSIKIGSIDQVISVIGRSGLNPEKSPTGDLLRIKVIDNYFVITDGAKAGKFKARIATPGVAEFIESYQSVKDKPNHFSIPDMAYLTGKCKYETGYEIPYESLTELLRDAKAFGFENYDFSEVDHTDKDGKVSKLLNCTIMNLGTKDSFIRRLLTIGKISDQPIPEITVGHGFREIIGSLDKEVVEKGKLSVKIYFNKVSMLITNGVSYFINLHEKG